MGHALFDAGHADEDESHVISIKDVPQVFDGGVFQPFGFINDDQLDAFRQRPSAINDPHPGTDVPIDKNIDLPAQPFEFLLNFARRAADARGEEQGARAGQGGMNLVVGCGIRSPRVQRRLRQVPVGIAPGGQGKSSRIGILRCPLK